MACGTAPAPRHGRWPPNCSARRRPSSPSSRRPARCVVMCVSADRDVLSLVAAMAPALRQGSIVIDCSTVGADTARAASAQLRGPRRRVPRCAGERRRRRRRQGHARDHGRRRGNRPGACPTRACRPWAPTITHFGAQGAGQAAKATNQIMVAGINRANAEALAFAAAYGLDLAQGDRHARAWRGRQLVSHPSRPEHGARRLSARLPGPAPPEGSQHLPRRWRAPAAPNCPWSRRR